ncbi:hypothetical protein FNL55_12540 [Tardiphaga sp. vice352]|uniref:hypothetical protein n=1 Tax=Tardiphaga sp. vice352 TaxID=2592816 RepID=UPI001164E700|nr:hypothetical protein [Tardiphaga sp. vice352]QDM32066.1 hypothetical protein FNL55_12540 [Tardiphaga sp. vice352]
MRVRPLSPAQRQCIIEATIEPLAPYPRGYARAKTGPFFDTRTVHYLVLRGHLRIIKDRVGPHFRNVSARAA